MLFTKMQGAGNDFVMLRPSEADIDLDWERLALKMCHRRFGIGADGIILALPSQAADIKMRIFNSDGSEAEICGNGLRCLAKYAVVNKMVEPGAPQINIETIPGIIPVKLCHDDSELTRIQVGIGVPRLAAEDIPVNIGSEKDPVQDYPLDVDGRRLYINCVSMGNPHAVCFINEKVAGFPLPEIGPRVEQHVLFPKKTNFEIARVLDRQTVEMRVWERGAGETLACGTGACAVAVAARLHQFVENEVDIILPGGTLNIEWDGKGQVLMSGPAEIVFTGEWPQ